MKVHLGPFLALRMIINADSLVTHLKGLVRLTQSDDSRHLICPHCAVRTKLHTLGDGRRKCSVCGRKFRIHKSTDERKLQQCSEILLSFCIDLPGRRAASITGHRYRLVASYYLLFRTLLAGDDAEPRSGARLRLIEETWKQRHRLRSPDEQARVIIALMLPGFLLTLP